MAEEIRELVGRDNGCSRLIEGLLAVTGVACAVGAIVTDREVLRIALASGAVLSFGGATVDAIRTNRFYNKIVEKLGSN